MLIAPTLAMSGAFVASASARDWVDYATLAATIFAALGTVSAVVVALFGPRWRAVRRQPNLYARSQSPALAQSRPRRTSPEKRNATEFPFVLGNARGREPARDVEVFLAISRGVNEVAAIGGPDRIQIASRLTVPPGFERLVPIMLVGTDELIRRHLGLVDEGRQGVTDHHTVSFATNTEYGPMWVDPGTWDVSIYVTGSNFDARRFDGMVSITREMQADDRVTTTLSWEDDLREVRFDAPRRRRSPTREELEIAIQTKQRTA